MASTNTWGRTNEWSTVESGFVFRITTTTANQSFTIPCASGTFNATVNYGDGTNTLTVTTYNDANLTHSFASAGQYTINIVGTFPNVRFGDSTVNALLVDDVLDLGDVGWANLNNAFARCSNLTSFTSGTGNTSNVTSMNSMFLLATSLQNLDVTSFDTSNVDDMFRMFSGLENLTNLDVTNFDTSNVNDMFQMFLNCILLASLDLTSFDTSNVTTMQQMFQSCKLLTSLDVTNFDTSSVTNMQEMFSNCNSLTSLDVTNFDTSNVTTMVKLFSECSSLSSLDVSGFNTSNVTNMQQMFSTCSSLTSLDLSSFETSNNTRMFQTFFQCSSLKSLDLRSFNTEKVNSYRQTFLNCNSLTSLQLGAFNNLVATDMVATFASCSSLTSLDLSGFTTPQATSMRQMFFGCTNLTNISISHFDVSNVVDALGFLGSSNNALTQASYKTLLEAWARQDVQENVQWHFGSAQYVVETIPNWYSPRISSSLSVVNNQLISIADSALTSGQAQQVDNLVIGSLYRITASAYSNNLTSTVFIRVSESQDLELGNAFNIQSTGSVEANDIFEATATTMYIGALIASHAADDFCALEAGVSLKEIYTGRIIEVNFVFTDSLIVDTPNYWKVGIETDNSWGTNTETDNAWVKLI